MPRRGEDEAGKPAVGDLMRNQIAVALDAIKSSGKKVTLPEEMKPPRFRVNGVAPSTLNFRDAPGGEKKGELRERTIVEKLSESGDWWQVRTLGGHVGWVFASYLTPDS